jgi:hypothetical protein
VGLPLVDIASAHVPTRGVVCVLVSTALRSPIDFTVYSAWVGKHPSVLNFLDVLQQVARIEMGIRPPTLREEAALIQSVFKEFDPIKPGCVGDTWYVLQYDWWKQWSHQSGFDGSRNRGGAGMSG